MNESMSRKSQAIDYHGVMCGGDQLSVLMLHTRLLI